MEPGAVFTGQWVGVVENGDSVLVVEPKLREFPVIYREVVEAAAGAEAVSLAVAGVHLGGLHRLPGLAYAVRLLDDYVEHTPPYVVEEQRVPGVPAPLGKRLRPNASLAATALAGAALLRAALTRIYEALRGLGPHAWFLEPLAERHRRREEELLALLAPRLAMLPLEEALRGDPDLDVLAEVALAARAGPGGEGAGARVLMAPAPKIYELYVLLKLHEALEAHGWRLAGRSLHRWRYRRGGEKLSLYYNRPRSRASRLLYGLTGSPPHPDIFAEKHGETAVVVDAKYMVLGAERPGKGLPLADALRLLGYVADLSRNHELRAAVAAPRVGEGVPRSLSAGLDGVSVAVDVLEVRPGVNQLRGLAARL